MLSSPDLTVCLFYRMWEPLETSAGWGEPSLSFFLFSFPSFRVSGFTFKFTWSSVSGNKIISEGHWDFCTRSMQESPSAWGAFPGNFSVLLPEQEAQGAAHQTFLTAGLHLQSSFSWNSSSVALLIKLELHIYVASWEEPTTSGTGACPTWGKAEGAGSWEASGEIL